jgi:hypothetical protein
MDSEVLPHLFYPDDYKTNISGANVVLLNQNKHPPEGFWYTTETLWKFKISLCETAPIAIFSSHFGSNMPLKPDIANFYETLTEAKDFKHLRYEISVEVLENEIKSQLRNHWSLIDLRVSSASSTSIEGQGLLNLAIPYMGIPEPFQACLLNFTLLAHFQTVVISVQRLQRLLSTTRKSINTRSQTVV